MPREQPANEALIPLPELPEAPPIPVEWDFDSSVRATRRFFKKTKDGFVDCAQEAWIARACLDGRGGRANVENSTFADWCEAVGIHRSTPRNWFIALGWHRVRERVESIEPRLQPDVA